MTVEAESGHGSILAVELTPDVNPGVFTDIAEIFGDFGPPAVSRSASETTPHNKRIDYHITSKRIMREPMTLTLNLIPGNNTQDAVSGLYFLFHNQTYTGFRFRGPDGTTDDDEIIMSGEITNISQNSPARDGGQRTMDVTIQMSGPYIMDGVVVGN